MKGNQYFKDYKDFFVKSLKDNEIDFIFETVEKNKTITELILDKECYSKSKMSDILVRIEINNKCDDLK